MTQHIAIESLNARSSRRRLLSRRQVMVGAAGFTFAVVLGVDRRAAGAMLVGERSGKTLSPWVSIATDGTITIMSPATEMGQGSMTSLPLIIAEELDADWSKVRVVPAPPIDAIYGNPGFQGMMYTAGSNAVTSYYRPLRVFGAQVRRVLMENAGKKLGVPLEELATEPSVVVHAKSGSKLSYGEIAAFAGVPAHRQGCDAGGAAGQGQRQRPLQHRRAGAEHALRCGPARTRGRFGSGQDRRYQSQGDRRRGQDREVAVWRRRARGNAMGGVRGAPSADPICDLEQNRHRLGLRQR